MLALAGFIVLCLAAGGLGSFATSPKIPTWYAELTKPTWNPPSWVFAPVWTTLYVLMGIAAWLVWRQPRSKIALRWFWAQLVLNTAWSFLFFGMEQPGAAFVEIVAMWIAIAVTALAFRRLSLAAAWLLAPYLAWVSFAALLNFEIWRLNS